jgi:hypothetical protein
MTQLNFTIKITEALSDEWLQEENQKAGPSTAGDDDNDSECLKKLPGNKQDSKKTKHGDRKRRGSRTVRAKCSVLLRIS